MAQALTESSKLACAHQGKVKLTAGQSKLTVGGAKVLIDGDLAGASILACITVTDPNTGAKVCQTVAQVAGGVSSKLTVGGKGVLLDTVQGVTDGTVGGAPQTWSVQTAGETSLKAV